jgi:predicted O-linked N-acetylglucosamine transferase (SPINDLY family)
MNNLNVELNKLLLESTRASSFCELIECEPSLEKKDMLYSIVASRLMNKNPYLAEEILQSQTSDRSLVARVFIAKQIGNSNQIKILLKQLLEKIDKNLDEDIVIKIAVIAAQYGFAGLIRTRIRKIWKEKKLSKKQYPIILDFSKRVADWGLYISVKEELEKLYKNNEFSQINETPRNNLIWSNDEYINYRVIRNWFEEAYSKTIAVFKEGNKGKNKKIRIGYLSSDFRNHPTSRLIKGLLREHDKNKFSLVMFCSGWDDESDLRKEVVSYFDETYSVAKISDESAADLIKKKNIDVLIELNGPTASTRLGILKYRPARVIIGYLGWPGSYFNLADYIIADDYVVPKSSEVYYSEKLIKLHKTYQVNDYFHERELRPVTKNEYGFHTDDLILGAFNQINKINPECWMPWMKILQKVSRAKLWMFKPNNQIAIDTLIEYARRFNVDDKRIIFAGYVDQDQHLNRLQICDLMLDTWPYTGHTTTSDAIYAGVPVLAVEGTSFPSRVSGGLLKAAGLELFIRKSIEDYIIFGTQFLSDEKNIHKAKKFIREKSYKMNIFDTVSKARQIESALEKALERHKNNIKHTTINFISK